MDRRRPVPTDEESKAERRGWWTGKLVEGKKVKIRVDWNSCMGSSSCISLAPSVFKLDWDKKKSFFDPAPLEIMDEGSVDPVTIFLAAQSCPYKAIIVEDESTHEQIYP
jgi:ferredoxin